MGKVIGFRRPRPYHRLRFAYRTNKGRVGLDCCGGRGSAGWNTCFRSRFSNGRMWRQRQHQPGHRRADLSRCRPGVLPANEGQLAQRRALVLLGGRCSKSRVEKSTALSGNGEQERPDLVLFVGFRLNRFVHDPLGTRSLGAVFGFVFFGLLCFSIGVLLTMRHVIALHAKGDLTI